ncbi:ankyrin repeat protein, partial [Rhexocercosporidium sp. MPI-PUGE-AT-0058]
TPLHYAAANGSLEAARVLLSKGARELPDREQETPLMLAARRCNADTVKALLDFGASVTRKNERGETALALAIDNSNEPTVRHLLNYGADIEAADDEGLSVIDLAILRG